MDRDLVLDLFPPGVADIPGSQATLLSGNKKRQQKIVSGQILALCLTLLVCWPCGTVRGGITVVNPTGANYIPELVVPPDNDLVTLGPDEAIYTNEASPEMQNLLNTGFPASSGFGFTYHTTGLNGTLTVELYQAASSGPHNGGADIRAVYKRADGDPLLQDLRFIQRVDTTHPLGGTSSPYIDPRPNDDNLPFYYTDGQAPGKKDGLAATFTFEDSSRRNCPSHPGVVDWTGELLLADFSGGTGDIDVYDGIIWGWSFFCQSPYPPPVPSGTPTVPPSSGQYTTPPVGQGGGPLTYVVPGQGTVEVSEISMHSFDNVNSAPSGADEATTFTASVDAIVDFIPEVGAPITGQAVAWNASMNVLSLGKAGSTTGVFETELLSMELTGMIDTPSGPVPVLLRERPDVASLGEESIGEVVNTEAKDGSFDDEGFLIDSFFDVFTELSLDEGAMFVPDLHESSRLSLVPEPSAVMLLVLGAVAVGSSPRSRRALHDRGRVETRLLACGP